MDAATVEQLIATADEARAEMRRGEDAAGIEQFESMSFHSADGLTIIDPDAKER